MKVYPRQTPRSKTLIFAESEEDLQALAQYTDQTPKQTRLAPPGEERVYIDVRKPEQEDIKVDGISI